MGCSSPPSPGTEEWGRSPVWAADDLCLVVPPPKKEKEGKLLVLLLPLWCFCLERSQQIWSDSTLLFISLALHNFSLCYNSVICITKDEAHVYRRKHQKVPCAQSSRVCRVTPLHLRPTENKRIPPFSQQTSLASLSTQRTQGAITNQSHRRSMMHCELLWTSCSSWFSINLFEYAGSGRRVIELSACWAER